MFSTINPNQFQFDQRDDQLVVTCNGKRVKFQIGTKSLPLTAKYRVSSPFPGETTSRRDLDLNITSDTLSSFLTSLDDSVKANKRLFSGKLKPLVKEKDGTSYFTVKVKDETAKFPTQIVRMHENKSTAPIELSEIRRDTEMLMILSVNVWQFNQLFGFSLQADKIIVLNTPEPDFVTDFILD